VSSVYVRTAGMLTREQLSKIAERVTDILERIAKKPRSCTHIVYDELPDGH
jgi:4-oxalocrotonate tautomerase